MTTVQPKDRIDEQAQLLDLAQDAIVVHGLDAAIRYWNAGAQRIFGFTREQALGHSFESLMGPGAALSPAATAELLEKGEWTGELECFAADGTVVSVARRCTVRRNNDGHAVAVLTISTNVTERRRAEKEIVLLNNLLERRIDRRTAELEVSNKDLRDFAYSVAHDLRAPLSSIDGFSTQLERRLEGRLDEKELHYMRRIRAGVKLMADLTDALLDLADLSHTPLRHESVDLSELARAIGERLREQAPERNARLMVQETPSAQGDPRLLAVVLQNLLGNAWKFSAGQPAAHIVFGAQELPEGGLCYFIQDNGAGFDPSYAARLFGLFQRLHSKSEFEGTGIGLAVVRKIVSRHGGRVWAKARPGEGATFYFTLHECGGFREPAPLLALHEQLAELAGTDRARQPL